MLLTIKNLQQQTFHVEFDPSETVSRKWTEISAAECRIHFDLIAILQRNSNVPLFINVFVLFYLCVCVCVE